MISFNWQEPGNKTLLVSTQQVNLIRSHHSKTVGLHLHSSVYIACSILVVLYRAAFYVINTLTNKNEQTVRVSADIVGSCHTMNRVNGLCLLSL